MSPLLEELRANKIKTPRVIVYCRSLNLYSSLYFFFLSNLGSESYYPSGAVEISDNRLFGMFYAQTPQHKDAILSSMQKEDGIVWVVFATLLDIHCFRGAVWRPLTVDNFQCAIVTKCNIYVVESCIHLHVLECVIGIMYMYSDSIEM